MVDFALARWKSCNRCGLCSTRKHVVLGRGATPCEVLFIGEAPGRGEDVLGKIFIGPAGKVLEQGIALAAKWNNAPAPSYYITNACACRPTDAVNGENRAPSGDELWACFQRLEWECNTYASSAKHVVFLGKVAEGACRKLFPKGIALQHPAYILRCGGLPTPAGIKFVRELSTLFKEVQSEENAEACPQSKPIRRITRSSGGDG